MCSKICSSSVCTILATSATSLRSPAYRLSLESTVEGWKIPDIQEFKKPLNQHPPLAAMHTNPHLSQASRSHSRDDKGRLALEINIFRSNLIDISTKNSSYDVIGQPTGSLSTTDNEQPHFEISFFTGLQEVLNSVESATTQSGMWLTGRIQPTPLTSTDPVNISFLQRRIVTIFLTDQNGGAM